MTDETSPAPQDVSGAYMAHRDDLEGQAAISEMQQRVAAQESAAPGASPPPGQARQPGRRADSPTSPTFKPGGPLGFLTAGTAGAAGKDLAKGTVEAPLVALGGVRNAFQNAIDFGRSAGDWVEQKADLPVFMFDQSGVHIASNQEAKGHRLSDLANLPDSDLFHPTTVTGGVVQGIAQFVTGFKGAGKAMDLVGIPQASEGLAGWATNQGKSLASLAAFFDPMQERLSNLIEKFPALSNPVTRFLEAKPDDSEAMGRLKSALEGFGIGQLADGFTRAMQALRAYTGAQAASTAAQEGAGAAGAAQAPEAGAEAAAPAGQPAPPPSKGMEALGDATKPPILERPPQGPGLGPHELEAAAERNVKSIDVEGRPPIKLAGEDKLTPANAAIERKFARSLAEDYAGAVDKYNQLPGTEGGKVLSADVAKELSPDYLANRSQSSGVHEPASWFIKERYKELLAQPPKEGEEPMVLFTAGGMGAGKSTALNESAAALKAKAQIVYDTNMAKAPTAISKVDQALEAGKKVRVLYVDKDPLDSLDGALHRAEKQAKEGNGTGRAVDTDTLVDTHQQATATLRTLAKHFEDKPQVEITVLDNNGVRGEAKPYPNAVDDIPKRDYTSIREQAHERVEEAYRSGEISENTYRGFRGEDAGGAAEPVQQAAGLGAGGGGRPEPGSAGGRADGVDERFQSPQGPPGAETGPTRINFSRIESPDDVKRVMQAMANEHAGEIDTARRGVQSFEQIKLDAAHEDAWKVLTERRLGEPLNAAQMTAARELWVSSGQKLVETARIARESTNHADLAAFLKMVETHRVIQAEVRGAQTETARALASMRIPVGADAAQLAQLEGIVREGYGGEENVREFAAKVSGMADANYATELDAFVQKSAYVRTRDALIQAWTDALLTSPVTQVRILASNATTALWRIGERSLAEKVSWLTGSDAVAPGEAAAMWQAYTNGWRETFAAGWKAFKTGQMGEGIGEGHEAYPSKLSSEALQLSANSFSGKAADLLGTVLSVPRRAIAAQHDMALTQAYRAELNAQAVRQATHELNTGQITQEQMGERVASIIADPPPNLRMNAVNAGKYQAFLDEPGKLAAGLLKMRQDVPAVRAILPFIKIPARIFSYTMERTPLAPLMSKFQGDIAAGGARRDLAIAQVGLGTFASLAVADMTLTGKIKAQGPLEKGVEQAQEREGERNWSVQIGDSWYSYNGIHPAGKLIGLAAAVTEAITNGQHEIKDDTDVEKLWVATTLAIAGNLSNASYTQGLANFFAMVHDSRVGGAGEQSLLSMEGSAVPSASAAVARAVDPNVHSVYSMLDEFKSRIPGLSSTLPPRRDLWGYPVPSRNPGLDGIMGSLLSPAPSRPATHSPIDDEIQKQGMNIAMPNTHVTFGNGASVDLKQYPEAYSRYLELSGHALKSPAWGVGAKDLLDSIVSGNHPLSSVYRLYSDGPDGGKKQMIENTIARYREDAKRQLLTEFPKLRNDVDQRQAHARELKMPVL